MKAAAHPSQRQLRAGEAASWGGTPRPSTPLVTAAESAEDQQFFFEHPERRYRITSRWVVRRRGVDVFLRAPILPDPHADDSEGAAEHLWWLAAWPNLDPKTRKAMAKTAHRGSRIFKRAK